MDEQKERAAFEAWCQSIGFTTWRNTEGDYLPRYGAELWSGWQARAALAAAPAPAPLTYAEIEALRCIDDCGEAAPEFSRIVRIAERAHGIGTDAAPAPHPDTADAQRYRWLRDNHEHVASAMHIVNVVEGADWDAAIDAARAQARRG